MRNIEMTYDKQQRESFLNKKKMGKKGKNNNKFNK
jgi:hypothetical protein